LLFYNLKGIEVHIGESPLNRNEPKSEQYSLDLLKRDILNFQSIWRHRSELGFVPDKGTLPYNKFVKSFHHRVSQCPAPKQRVDNSRTPLFSATIHLPVAINTAKSNMDEWT
jgi:hypothetical protein